MLKVFQFELAKGGHGGVLVYEVCSIVSDEKNHKLSWLYTELFRDGIWIKGVAQDLIAMWDMQMEMLSDDGLNFEIDIDEEEEDEQGEEG